MVFWKRRTVQQLAIGALLPLLLLAFLFVQEWKANHPPLSRADRVLRAAIAKTGQVGISGFGAEWTRLTGASGSQSLIVTNKMVLQEIVEALRCSGKSRIFGSMSGDLSITIAVPSAFAKKPHLTRQWFTFVRNRNQAGLVLANLDGPHDLHQQYVQVHPRFAPRFEALVADLARRAKAGEAGLMLIDAAKTTSPPVRHRE